MTFAAFVEENWPAQTVRIVIADRMRDGSLVYAPDGSTLLIEHDGMTHPEAPAFQIPRDALPALLAALSQHLGAVEHPVQLRRDYDAERARVDRLIDYVMQPPRTAVYSYTGDMKVQP